MRILVTNDDGVQSPGIKALAECLSSVGEVWVCAPDRERSASSHSLSLFQPLRVNQLDERVFSTDGTPADCAYLGINLLMKHAKPDLVVSGINHGPNVADDITYSGTVAAALEATMLGIPSVAVSLCHRGRVNRELEPAARFAKSLVTALKNHPLPPGVLLNVNVPSESDGVRYRVTRQGKRSYAQDVIERVDPRGRRYYWLSGSELAHENVPGSDANAVYDERVISVTPLHLDMTHESTLRAMAHWKLDDATRVGDAE